jgi:hypothetical protein
MDDIDRAQARDAQAAEAALAEVRYQASRTGLAYTGHCHYCGAITGGGRRFCDADCRDDYDQEKKMQAIKGRSA